jgi:hypothetical protein
VIHALTLIDKGKGKEMEGIAADPAAQHVYPTPCSDAPYQNEHDSAY